MTFYTLISLLSSVMILVMGICLVVVSAPEDAELKNYRISRYFLAGAYAVLSAVGLLEMVGNAEPGAQPILMAFTLIAASFQALLFTFSLITLINLRYISMRRVLRNILPISAAAVVLLAVLFYAREHFYPLFYSMLGLYCAQLVYYIILFSKEYRRFRRRLDNYFSDNEYRRSIWIRNAFAMALCVGVVAVIALFVSTQAYVAFTVAYTVFYVYFAIKTLNYISLFPLISSVVSPSEPTAETVASGAVATPDLEQWVADKKYLARDITLDGLARTLNTNAAYLSRLINKRYGQNFRSWIGSLRIGESMRLMDENPDIPLTEVAERTGIQNLSTFYRQFSAVTGLTPADYRKRSHGKSAAG